MDDELFFLDEVENAIDSLQLCSEYLESNNKFKWKWVSISLHHSLYSFCISCLTQGNFENVLSTKRDDEDFYVLKGNDKYFKKAEKLYLDNSPAYRLGWLQTEYSSCDELPIRRNKNKKSNKLIGFWTALARVQDNFYWMGRLDSRALKLSDEDIRKIVWLSNIRNELTHFKPKTFGISIRDIRDSSNIYLNAIEFLALQSRAITKLIVKPKLNEKIKSCLRRIRIEFIE